MSYGESTVRKPVQHEFTIGSYEDVPEIFVRLRWHPNDADWCKNLGIPTHWVDFEIIVPWGHQIADHRPIFTSAEHGPSESSNDIEKASANVIGFVKWDGCTQFWLVDEPAHFDDGASMKRVLDAICAARAKCVEIMKVDPP